MLRYMLAHHVRLSVIFSAWNGQLTRVKRWLEDGDTIILHGLPVSRMPVRSTRLECLRVRLLVEQARGKCCGSFRRIAHLQHVQKRRLAGIVETEEQELGVLVQQTEGRENVVDYTTATVVNKKSASALDVSCCPMR